MVLQPGLPLSSARVHMSLCIALWLWLRLWVPGMLSERRRRRGGRQRRRRRHLIFLERRARQCVEAQILHIVINNDAQLTKKKGKETDLRNARAPSMAVVSSVAVEPSAFLILSLFPPLPLILVPPAFSPFLFLSPVHEHPPTPTHAQRHPRKALQPIERTGPSRIRTA